MAKPPEKPNIDVEVVWEIAPEFKDSWKKYGKGNKDIIEAMTEFNRCKRSIPPIQLPGKMKDHKLGGPLNEYMECHLANDVLLIYRPLGNGAYKLLKVYTHADLKGPKAKKLSAQLK
jgi:mRNA-degrading endonuclease YafQ of YafQ-DinJ toxin-antitoxin module